MRSLSLASIAVVCSLLLPAFAFGQGDRGTITGNVADPAGAVVSGAMLEARNTDTGAGCVANNGFKASVTDNRAVEKAYLRAFQPKQIRSAMFSIHSL